MPKSCKYAGNDYSHGGKVCQEGEVQECIDGEWSPTGKDCPNSEIFQVVDEDGKVSSFNFGGSIPSDQDGFSGDFNAKDWKQSEAYLIFMGNSATPNIEIKENTIWVYHGQKYGGRVGGTGLKGSGGKYIFKHDGKFTVEPGTYQHYVIGRVSGRNQWIGSGIRYK